MSIIKDYVNKKATLANEQAKKRSQQLNEQPCSVCGNDKFIQKFRNVVGEIKGSMQGHYSFFGGSFSGRIDGYTKTLPVLSCRNCSNEREISLFNYTYAKDVFWNDMYYFYFGIDKDEPERFKKIPQIYLDNPIETREFMLNNKNYDHKFYNHMVNWRPELWIKAGFKFPYKIIPAKVIPADIIKFLFWEIKIADERTIPEQKIQTFFN